MDPFDGVQVIPMAVTAVTWKLGSFFASVKYSISSNSKGALSFTQQQQQDYTIPSPFIFIVLVPCLPPLPSQRHRSVRFTTTTTTSPTKFKVM